MVLKNIFWGFTVVLFVYACGNNKSEHNTTTALSGKDIYSANCISCHGDDGKKGTLGASDLSKSTMDKNTMYVTLKDGKGAMPPMISVLTDKEIYAVIDFVETLRK